MRPRHAREELWEMVTSIRPASRGRVPCRPAAHAPSVAAAAPDDLGVALAGLRMLAQPIVELAGRQVVAYEALARGPVGHPLQEPMALFAAARVAGRLGEVDRACREAAVRDAAAAGFGPDLALFVNVEPASLDEDDLVREPPAHLRLVVEVTERDLTRQPAALLAAVRRVRARGWGVAVDDVGADPRSLALLPLLRPDVVKLDLRLVQQQPDLAVAETVSAVAAYAERTGALVLAEGIETEVHARLAQSMGATLGQGWLFGRPSALPETLPAPRRPVRLVPRRAEVGPGGSVMDAALRGREVARADKPLLIAMSKLLERQAAALGPTALVLGAFEEARFFTADTAVRYAELAQRVALVAALGAGMAGEPAVGVRGADLRVDDPVRGEWDIAVLSPHFAGALVARDLGDGGPDRQRRFDYLLTYDRDAVTDVAAALMGRVAAAARPSTPPDPPSVADELPAPRPQLP